MTQSEFDELMTPEKLNYLFREMQNLFNFANRLGANITGVNRRHEETKATLEELAKSVAALRPAED
jgi:hypothetical protein